MTPVDKDEDSGYDGDDLFAAEYVLGVLGAEERTAAARRIDSEIHFSRLIDRWEAHFSVIASAYPEVEPPTSVKTALDFRLFQTPRKSVAGKTHIWSSLLFWRGLAATAVILLLLQTIIPRVLNETPQSNLVASLTTEGSDVRYVIVFDARNAEVGLSHLSGERGTGHDFELWMIEDKNPPVSMGIIPVGATTRLRIPQQILDKISSGASLAISREPSGGSPTGQPTGPVVAVGELKAI